MKQSDTLVSVLLPVYNADAHLAACLESLLKQTYRNLEVIAIDDASRDRSCATLRAFARTDKRLRVYRNIKRYGPAVCLNRAVKRARGRFIAFMNPHDVNSLHRIKRQVSFLKANPKVVVVGTQCTFMDAKGKKTGKTAFPTVHETIYQTLLHNQTMRFETVLIDRSLLPKDILYFSRDTYPFVYSEVILRLLQYGQFANLSGYLYYPRETLGKTFKALTTSDKVLSFTKLVVNAFAEHDYRPSVRAFIQPFFSPIKTILNN